MTARAMLGILACPVLCLSAQEPARKPDLSVEDYLRERRAPAEARMATDALFRSGMESRAAGRYAEAEEIFRAVRKQEPLGTRAIYEMASVYVAEGRTDDAIAYLQSEVSQRPVLDLVELLADTAAKSGRFDLALQALRNALRQPLAAAAEIYMRIAGVCRAKGDLECSMTALRQAVEANPRDVAAAGELAAALESVGQIEESQTIYRRVLGVDPNDGAALGKLAGELSAQSSDLDRAMVCAQRASQLLPESVVISDTLGFLYLKTGRTDDAVAILRKVVDKEPAVGEYQIHLVLALVSKGDTAGARTAIENAQRSGADSSRLQNLLNSLGTMRQ